MAMMFLAPVFVVPRLATQNPVIHSKELIVYFLCATLLFFYLVRLVLVFELRIALRAIQLSVAGLLLTTIVSSLVSGYPIYSLQKAAGQLLLFSAFFITQDVVRGLRAVGKVRSLILLSGVLVCAYGLLQYWNPGFLSRLFPYEYGEEARHHLLATLGNPEYLGGYVTPLALLVLPTILLGRRALLRVLGAVCFCLFIATVLLSEARGAWLGFVGGLALIALIFWKGKRFMMTRRQIIAVILLIFLLALLVAIFSFPNAINTRNISIIGRFTELFHAQSDSIRERVLFYSVSADMIFDHPVLGLGSGMFQVKFYQYVDKLAQRDTTGAMAYMIIALRNRATDTPHNDFLQFWVEAGTVGFMFFALFLVAFFATTVPSLISARVSSDYLRLQCGIAAAVLCLAINATFSFPLHLPVRASLFWILSSLGCSLYFTTGAKGESAS
jgi:O-antigen ligase